MGERRSTAVTFRVLWRRLLPLLLVWTLIQIVLLVSIPVVRNYSASDFSGALLHAEIGAVAAALAFVHPALTLGFTAMLIAYQTLQTVSGQGPLSNDDNVLEYSLGYAVVGIVYGLVRHLFPGRVDRDETSLMMKGARLHE